MKTFIKPFAVVVMLLFAGASFAQTAHPVVHRYSKHHRHHKHHKRAHHIAHRLPAPPPPPGR